MRRRVTVKIRDLRAMKIARRANDPCLRAIRIMTRPTTAARRVDRPLVGVIALVKRT